MRIGTLTASAIASLLALVACATPPGKAGAAGAKPLPDTTRCMAAKDLAEWEPLDARTILLFISSSRRAYLAVLAAPLDSLEFADDIEVVDGDLDGFICPGDVHGLYVLDCDCEATSIVSMEYLTEKQTIALLGQSPFARSPGTGNDIGLANVRESSEAHRSL
jgi:hypothetical protein